MAQLNCKVIAKKNPQTGDFGWMLAPILYSKIGRDAILDAAQRNSQIPRSYLQQTFDALEVELKNFVMNGHSITLDRFGTIYSTIRNERGVVRRRDYRAPAMIKLVKFGYRPSAKIRALAQRTSLVITEPYVINPAP